MLQFIEQAPYVLVEVVHQPRIHLHVGGHHIQLIGRHFVPLGNARRELGALPVFADDPQLALAREALFADGVPPCVVAPLVLGQVLRLGMVGRVRRVGRQVKKEGFFGGGRDVPTQHGDGAVGEIVGREVVVAVRVDILELVAFHQLPGSVVVGFRTQKSIEAVKTALQWPTGFVLGARLFDIGRVVPFAHGVG